MGVELLMKNRHRFVLGGGARRYCRDDTYFKKNITLCSNGLRRLFDFPAGTKEIDLVFTKRPHPDAYQVISIDLKTNPVFEFFSYTAKIKSSAGKIMRYRLTPDAGLWARAKLPTSFWVRVEY
jgi:hypothetical protein